MTERNHYKYVVLDSSKENGNAVQAKFNVQIPHGITNESRVCVKSFSMPNVIHNVYGYFKTVRFVEFYRPTAGGNWVYDIFNFTLPDGYDETVDLISTLQAKFTNTSGNEITRESDGTTVLNQLLETWRLTPKNGGDPASICSVARRGGYIANPKNENLAGSFFGARYCCGTCREQRDMDSGGRRHRRRGYI